MSESGDGIDLLSIVFNPSQPFTLGVEVEFQVVDRDSFELVPRAPLLLENMPESLRPALTPEFIQSILEVQTGICSSVEDVEKDLKNVCLQSIDLAARYDTLLVAASLHPEAIAAEQLLSEGQRYSRIMEELQIVGRRFITQGIHVHVGLPDGETTVRVCDAIQPFLPLLLALSTSSPYYEGVDTGFMSYRTKLFEAMPMAGLFGYIGNWDTFLKELHNFSEQGVAQSIKDLWWDARPHPDFGTLEIRACDLPTRFTDILALTALVQALVATLCRENIRPGPYSRQLLKYNKWQAARHGLRGFFVDPTAMLTQKRTSFVDAVRMLIEKVTPAANELKCQEYFKLIDSILERGTGADQMRKIFRNTNDLKQVTDNIHQEFWK